MSEGERDFHNPEGEHPRSLEEQWRDLPSADREQIRARTTQRLDDVSRGRRDPFERFEPADSPMKQVWNDFLDSSPWRQEAFEAVVTGDPEAAAEPVATSPPETITSPESPLYTDWRSLDNANQGAFLTLIYHTDTGVLPEEDDWAHRPEFGASQNLYRQLMDANTAERQAFRDALREELQREGMWGPGIQAAFEHLLTGDPTAKSPEGGEATARVTSIEAALEKRLNERHRSNWQNFTAILRDNPLLREGLNAILSISSFIFHMGGLGDAGTVVRGARRILGVLNYSNIAGHLGLRKQINRDLPGLFEKTEALLKKAEEDSLDEPESELLKDNLEHLLGYYKRGVDLERERKRYADAKSTEPKPAEAGLKGYAQKFREFLNTPDGKKLALNAAIYSTPMIALLVAPVAAPLVMMGVQGYSAGQSIMRMRDALSKEDKDYNGEIDNDPRASSAAPLYEFLGRYEQTISEGRVLSFTEERAVGSAEFNANRADLAEKLAAALDAGGTEAAKKIQKEGAAWRVGGGALAGLYYLAEQVRLPQFGSSQENQPLGNQTDSTIPQEPGSQNDSPETENPDIPADDKAEGPSKTEPPQKAPSPTPAATQQNPLPTAEGAFPVEPGEATPQADNSNLPTPEGSFPMEESGVAGEISSEAKTPMNLSDFDKAVEGEAANHDFNEVFGPEGNQQIIIDLDNDGRRDKAEVFKVIESNGKHYAMVNWADVRGSDGIPDYLNQTAIKIELDADGTHLSGGINGHSGILVNQEHPELAVSEIRDGKAHYSSEPDKGMIFNFGHKASIVEQLVGADAWEKIQSQLGTRLDRNDDNRDWNDIVARSGRIASLDGDMVPEIQVHKVGEAFEAKWQGYTLQFRPSEVPYDISELKDQMRLSDDTLAQEAYNSVFSYPELAFKLDSVQLRSETELNQFLDTIQTPEALIDFSPEVAQGLEHALGSTEYRDWAERELANRLDDGVLHKEDLLSVLKIEDKTLIPLDETQPNVAPLDKTTLRAGLDEIIRQKEGSAWGAALHIARSYLDQNYDSITKVRLVADVDSTNGYMDVLSIITGTDTEPNQREKQFILPQGDLK